MGENGQRIEKNILEKMRIESGRSVWRHLQKFRKENWMPKLRHGLREEGIDRRGYQEGKLKEVRVRMSLAGVSGLAIWMGGSATEIDEMINTHISFGHVML